MVCVCVCTCVRVFALRIWDLYSLRVWGTCHWRQEVSWQAARGQREPDKQHKSGEQDEEDEKVTSWIVAFERWKKTLTAAPWPIIPQVGWKLITCLLSVMFLYILSLVSVLMFSSDAVRGSWGTSCVFSPGVFREHIHTQWVSRRTFLQLVRWSQWPSWLL